MLEIEKNYRVCRRLYQALFYKIAEIYIQYVNALAPDEIQQLDAYLKANGLGEGGLNRYLKLMEGFH